MAPEHEPLLQGFEHLPTLLSAFAEMQAERLRVKEKTIAVKLGLVRVIGFQLGLLWADRWGCRASHLGPDGGAAGQQFGPVGGAARAGYLGFRGRWFGPTIWGCPNGQWVWLPGRFGGLLG
ncbi:unnamed protein product [Cuscuta campestris]|uniref:Uncharacterized protein n=1 Tax=Cuscuta campestris TaxID=132261 RepID=A0A484LDE8_9ASTE|nr:unnamed protein product [Cuscuta campestris]